MLFVIDVGNTHTVTGLFKNGQLIHQFRLKSDREMTSDEILVQYHTLFSMTGISPENITGVVLASVVPSLQASWLLCCDKLFSPNLNHPVFIVNTKSVSDLVTVKINNPEDVGADRLVNAIAGYHQYRCELIIVDFGTAITFDCVTAKCEYLGGAIFPGIGISMEALFSRTAKLPHIDISQPIYRVIGKDTRQAMKSGVMNGFGSLIDGMIVKIKKEMDDDPLIIKVLATGGMAGIISNFTGSFDHVDPQLTLKGLELIYQKKMNHHA